MWSWDKFLWDKKDTCDKDKDDVHLYVCHTFANILWFGVVQRFASSSLSKIARMHKTELRALSSNWQAWDRLNAYKLVSLSYTTFLLFSLNLITFESKRPVFHFTRIRFANAGRRRLSWYFQEICVLYGFFRSIRGSWAKLFATAFRSEPSERNESSVLQLAPLSCWGCIVGLAEPPPLNPVIHPISWSCQGCPNRSSLTRSYFNRMRKTLKDFFSS